MSLKGLSKCPLHLRQAGQTVFRASTPVFLFVPQRNPPPPAGDITRVRFFGEVEIRVFNLILDLLGLRDLCPPLAEVAPNAERSVTEVDAA